MKHVIQKQTIDIAVPSPGLVHQWEKNAYDLVESVINPTIDKCFEQGSPKENILFIDQLQIDLGNIHAMTDQDIKNRLSHILIQELEKYTHGSVYSSEADILPIKKQESTPERFSEQGTRANSFIYFLVYGQLPWWVETGTFVSNEEWISGLSEEDVKLIAHELSANNQSKDRLIYQFDDTFISKLLGYFSREISKTLLKNWQWLEKIISSFSVNLKKLRKAYWKYWISNCMGLSDHDDSIVHILSQFIRDSAEFKSKILTLIKIESRSNKNSSFTDEERMVAKSMAPIFVKALDTAKSRQKLDTEQDIEKSVPKDSMQEKPVNKKEEQTALSDTDRKHDKSVETSPQESERDYEKVGSGSRFSGEIQKNLPIDQLSSEGMKKDLRQEELFSEGIKKDLQKESLSIHTVSDPIYCEAAGLVILHPFLEELFRTLHVWEKDHWTSDSSQHQAVFLVAWLAYGKFPVPEYLLTIPKLLCGMPFGKPVDTSAELGESFFNAGTELLEAVVTHWKALGNTSAEGLREEFIRREGKLTCKDNSWHLVVEKKTQDILLNRLSWSISFILLPWTEKKSIRVDWY